MATSVESTPPKPTLKAFSTTTTRRALASASRTASMGNGRNEVMPSAPMRMPGVALGVDDVLDRPEHRAHGDDHDVGVGAAVRVHQSARVAPEGLGELLGQLPDAPERLQLAGVREVAHLLERLGPDHGADGVRVVGIEQLAGLVGRQERVDLLLRRAGPRARWRG